MYLVELQQGDRHHTVGLFEEKKDAKDWIESLPYVHKQVDIFEEIEFVTYTMEYEDLPLKDEIIWKESRYPITKYMFTPDDGPIGLFIWDKLPIMSKVKGLVEGMTQVDAYVIPNEEVEIYIKEREEVREVITRYYNQLGKSVEAGGLGSQDGEYLLIENGPLIHLDAFTISKWQERTTIEQFIEQLEA